MAAPKYLEKLGLDSIDISWKPLFLESKYELEDVLKAGVIGKEEVWPRKHLVFNVFRQCPLNKIKIVILGQDPYHGPGQANGLAFSVNRGINIPPSLRNIYKELYNDIEGFEKPNHGDLTEWVRRGVFLLNTSLTVDQGKANSHANLWASFTDKAIKYISLHTKNVVFILWGGEAKKKLKLINQKAHKIITSSHPSPLSAHSGFFGSRCFSTANEYLESKGIEPVNWQLD